MLQSASQRAREARRAFGSVLTNPGLRRIEVAWGTTICAYWIFIVTLSLYAYQQGGAQAVGLVALLRTLPSLVVAPFVTALGDRYPRERVLLAINLGRTVTIAGAATAALAHAPAGIVYVLGALMGLLQSAFRPTQSALLPLVARTPDELTAANLVLTTLESVGLFVGPAVGGLLLVVTGIDTVFGATAVVFLVSVLFLAGVQGGRTAARRTLDGGFLRQAFAGWRTVVHDGKLRLIIGLYGLQTLVAGALNVLLVILALKYLHLGKAGIGYLNSAVGVGGLLGGVGALSLLGKARLASALGIGLALAGVPIALIGASRQTAVALVLLAVVGIGVTIVDVAGVTLLQRAVPDEVLTRVMGVVQAIFVGTLGLGAIVTPALISGVGIRATLVATGAVLPVATLAAWSRLRALERETAAPQARELELLSSIPLFRPLGPAMLEELASHLVPLEREAGEAIVRQGELGDRFYVVAEGIVDVSVDGQPGPALEAGDHFGEIALLHDVPRTATVRARTAVRLLALDREIFLGAVTGNTDSSEAAHAVAAARIAALRPTVASV
jgi:MFS family permease